MFGFPWAATFNEQECVMSKYAVTLKNGKTIHVHADDEASALAHAKTTADAFGKDTKVGPKHPGGALQDQPGNPEKAAQSQPVSAVKVK